MHLGWKSGEGGAERRGDLGHAYPCFGVRSVGECRDHEHMCSWGGSGGWRGGGEGVYIGMDLGVGRSV